MENRTDILPLVKIQMSPALRYVTQTKEKLPSPAKAYKVICTPSALKKSLWVECKELNLYTIIPMPENRNAQITHIEYLVKEKLDEIS